MIDGKCLHKTRRCQHADGYCRSSLAYGIPPRIRAEHADVAAPDSEAVAHDVSSSAVAQAAKIFADLFSLTELLHAHLDQMYCVDRSPVYPVTDFANRLQGWTDSTTGITRRIILRGSNLSIPGAPNLRLAFLSLRFLHHRTALEAHRRECFDANDVTIVQDYYLQTRRAAEDVVMFVQELSGAELEDFWMPVLSFPLLSTMTFLVRSAAEFEDTVAGLETNGALKLAIDLMESLKDHSVNGEWDLGDLCLTQYEGILEQLQEGSFSLSLDSAAAEAFDDILPELTLFDTALFSS